MALCSIGQLQADACKNGFTCLDKKSFRTVELQLLYKLSGGTATVPDLIRQACANGFTCLDHKSFRTVQLQLLCNLGSS